VTVAVPVALAEVLENHLAHLGGGADAWLFTGEKRVPLSLVTTGRTVSPRWRQLPRQRGSISTTSVTWPGPWRPPPGLQQEK
jgi:hypothetical protein